MPPLPANHTLLESPLIKGLKEFFLRSELLKQDDVIMILAGLAIIIALGIVAALARRELKRFFKPTFSKFLSTIIFFFIFGIPFMVKICGAFSVPPGSLPNRCGNEIAFQKVWDWQQRAVVDATYTYHYSVLYSFLAFLIWYLFIASIIQIKRFLFKHNVN